MPRRPIASDDLRAGDDAFQRAVMRATQLILLVTQRGGVFLRETNQYMQVAIAKLLISM
jgi:hypothetical protein